MANYLLYDLKMIEDDSCMESFAKSLLKDLDKNYQINREDCDSDGEFEEKMLDAVYESIQDDLSRTDINYQELMGKFAKDIGQLLFDMDNHGYNLSSIQLSFFDNAKESFETLLYKYIQIHFDELKTDCLCQ